MRTRTPAGYAAAGLNLDIDRLVLGQKKAKSIKFSLLCLVALSVCHVAFPLVCACENRLLFTTSV